MTRPRPQGALRGAIVEALLVGLIEQVHMALEAAREALDEKESGVIDKVQFDQEVQATWFIVNYEVGIVLDMLAGNSDPTLSFKHRQARRVLEAYRQRVEHLADFTMEHTKAIFGRAAVDMLTSVHEIMLYDAPNRKRRSIADTYVKATSAMVAA